VQAEHGFISREQERVGRDLRDPPDRGDGGLRVYGAMIRSLDRNVGRVLDALQANGLSDDTLVVFASDNGGAHYIGLPDINKPYRGWKATFFEGGVRVPFFMRWPGTVPAATKMAAPVSHFDIFATALAAAKPSPPVERHLQFSRTCGARVRSLSRGRGSMPCAAAVWRWYCSAASR
jgi:arylsulfatase A-like enzyme